MLCISVTDEGIGFDPKILDQPTKESEGGWGLFRIRERLMLLGGRLDIESGQGDGSRFRLLAPQDASLDAGASPVRLASDVQACVLRILIADDHPALRKTFRELLEARPEFQVVGEAVNGLEAIAQAHALRPHVIVMDVSMPEMDGVEATRRIRAELPFVQILGFSIHSRTEEPHAIELAGAQGFFTKGLDTQRLIDHLLVECASLAAI
jgi:CheY-like chemotaxis protein